MGDSPITSKRIEKPETIKWVRDRLKVAPFSRDAVDNMLRDYEGMDIAQMRAHLVELLDICLTEKRQDRPGLWWYKETRENWTDRFDCYLAIRGAVGDGSKLGILVFAELRMIPRSEETLQHILVANVHK